MIYTFLPEKDTYITNKVINGTNCNSSNVGKAATLDIFKLNNENDSVKSWAILNILDQLPLNNETFTLIDTDQNQVTFKFVQNENNIDPGINIAGEDNIKIGLGITPFSKVELSSQISNIINKINLVTQNGPSGNLTLEILANTSGSTLLLEQKTPGDRGDTQITQSSSSNLLIKKDFSRLEYSNILIKFNLEDFKNNTLKNFSKSVFSNKNKFKAEIELIDISLGHTKPKDYSLTISPLSKSFDEGLGKDTILFEDIDVCNFISSSYNKINDTYETWGINNFLVENIDFYQSNNNINLFSEFYVRNGDEDITFDITEYLHQYLNNELEDKGFVIKLGDSSLFDDSSYFVKRLGSKHLLNKKFIPRLNIKVNEDEYFLPRNNTKVDKYYNTSHDFFLYNKQGGILKDIAVPSTLTEDHFSASLSYKEFSLVKKGIGQTLDIKKYSNVFGNEKQGIYKFNITENDVSRFDNFLSESIENSKSGSINFDLEWYWFKTGEVPEKRIIKTEKVLFLLPENDDFTEKNILSKVTINNSDLFANNTIQKLSFFFVDTKKQYLANKKQYDIKCENLGDVHIRIIDTYDNSIIIDYDNIKNSTKMFFNGKDYEYNLFCSDLFKNKTIRLEFIIIDEVTNSIKIIKDTSAIKVK